MVKSVKVTSALVLTPEAFVLQALAVVKGEGKKGLQSWQLNPAFRQYFGDKVDPIEITTQMRKDGKIAIFLKKGGASFYLRSDLKEPTLVRHDVDWAKKDAEGPRKKVAKPKSDDNFLGKILNS